MAYKKSAFQLPFGVLNISEEPVDLRYGPYTGIGTAQGETFHEDSPLTQGNRYKGLTIGIIVGGEVKEYWFERGIADSDLIEKSSGSVTPGTGDKSFEFEQTVPVLEWNINHNLGKYPSVSIIDSATQYLEGQVLYIDTNNIKITFNFPVRGVAYLN